MGLSESRPENQDEYLPEGIKPRALQNPCTTILEQIHIEKVKLDEKLERENNEILHRFLKSFIEKLKDTDAIFKQIYKQVYYTGSYYSDLRIRIPDEFDLNLVLELPKGARDVTNKAKNPEAPKKNKESLTAAMGDMKLQSCSTPLTVQTKKSKKNKKQQSQNPLYKESLTSTTGALTALNLPSCSTPLTCLPNKTVKKSLSEKKQQIPNPQHRFRENGMLFQYHPQVPSYMKYKIEDESILEKVPGLCKLFEGGFLMPEKVRKWLQSVVDKALVTYQPPHQIEKIVPKAAGPARNLRLFKRGGGVIDLDLVPVFEAPSSQIKPPGIKHAVKERVPDDLKCFLVPKPYQPRKQAPVNEAERARLWRAHYPNAENAVLKDRQCAKSIIRLLKLLRDEENWVVLASYYLKTVVLWHIIANPGEEYWRMNKIGERFLEVLKMLLKCIQERKIEYFFSSRYNLLEKLSESEAFNIGNRLAGIIRNIEKDSWTLWRIFRCTPTFDKPLTMT